MLRVRLLGCGLLASEVNEFSGEEQHPRAQPGRPRADCPGRPNALDLRNGA